MEVEGAAPLKLKYRKVVNDVEREANFQSIQSDELVPPPGADDASGPLILGRQLHAALAAPQRIKVPLNESLTSSGKWAYSVEEVQDVYGNVVRYAPQPDDAEQSKSKRAGLEQSFHVHEPPQVRFQGCDLQKPIVIAKARDLAIPLQFTAGGKEMVQSTPLTIEYLFTPADQLPLQDEQSQNAERKEIVLNERAQLPPIADGGLYTLTSIATEHCIGEVLEPSSCLLQHAPEPEVTVSSQEMFDKCAGSPVGLRLDLRLTGTPPFDVKYLVQRRGAQHHMVEFERIAGVRGQIELTPKEAGHYTYTFVEVSDAIYKARSLIKKVAVIEQEVKPAATAHFVQATTRTACIDQSVAVDIRLQGEGPLTLEYELVHGKKRVRKTIEGIETDSYEVVTDPLTTGGEYSLGLLSVTDGSKCKQSLKEDFKIEVRHQRTESGVRADPGLAFHPQAGRTKDPTSAEVVRKGTLDIDL